MLLTALEAAAITFVFFRGSILKRFRESGPAIWRELATCPLCAGVWIGAGWTLLRAASAGPISATWAFALTVLATGALTGAFAFAFARVLTLLDALIDKMT